MNTENTKPKSKFLTWLILIGIFIVVVAAILYFVRQGKLYPSTDDSYIQAHIVNIAPEVNGQVTQVLVKNHQAVTKGQLLFSIDPRSYRYAAEKAQAQLTLARQQGARIFPLIRANKEAPAQGDKIEAQIQEASAALHQAQYDLLHTQVSAPANGVIANLKVRVGDTVNSGINLFAIVEQQQFWVNANFKETQLSRIKVGQSATIKVDMYPSVSFKGIVQSTSPGAGTIFSLLPPENATGNWVKVTQRVTVKVMITALKANYPLLAGTSATTTVDTLGNKQ
jgi:membrane fusion protein (multidrug efflux system)